MADIANAKTLLITAFQATPGLVQARGEGHEQGMGWVWSRCLLS